MTLASCIPAVLLLSLTSFAVVGIVDPGLRDDSSLIKKELPAAEDLSVKKANVIDDKSGEAPPVSQQSGANLTPRVELSKSEANLGCATWKLKASMAKLSGEIAQCAQILADHPACPGIICGPSNPPDMTPVTTVEKKAAATSVAALDEDSKPAERIAARIPTGGTKAQAPNPARSSTGQVAGVQNRTLASSTRRAQQASGEDQDSGSDSSDDSDSSSVENKSRRAVAETDDNNDSIDDPPSRLDGNRADTTIPAQSQSQSNSRSSNYQAGDDGSRPNRSTGDNGSIGDQQSSNHDDIIAFQKCDSLRSAAESACKLTDDTEAATNSDSLTNTCKQSTDKGIKSTNSKADASSNCTQKFTQCAENCQDSFDTYSDSPDVEYFRTNRNACLALSENSSKMIDAGHSSYQLASSGVNCQENASESPQSAGGAESVAKNQAQARNPIAEALCAANPTAPGCSTASANAEPGALQAEGGIKDATQNQGNVDVADTAFDKRISSIFGDPATASAPGAKNAAIANNSGGAIPNAGSNAANANDSGGGNALMRGLKAVGQAITDIELGYLGGGYAMLIRGENPWADEPISEAEVNRAIAALGGAPKKIDPDLRRYLPGGDLAMNGTFLLPYETEFHGKWTNIFEKIHDRYTLKCKLAVLLDCPEKDR